MKKILVTGGAGYIGTYIVQRLLEKKYQVVVIDNLIYGDIGLKTFVNNPLCQFIEGDITSEVDMEQATQGCDAVIALAAIVGDPASNVNTDTTYRINYKANDLLITKCIEHGIDRVVFASSCSVYGQNNGKFITEESSLSPVSLYAETRIASEHLLIKNQNQFTPVILRLSTVFGYGHRMRFDLGVNIMTGKAAKGELVEIFGGNQWRPFIHADDAARAFIMAMEAPREIVHGQVFNVGSNKANYQVNQIGEVIKSTMPNAVVKQSKTVEDTRTYHVSFDKIKNKLGFEVEKTLAEGVEEIYNFAKGADIDIYNEKYHNVVVWRNINKCRYIPFAVPDLGEREKHEILDTIDSGWLSTGPKSRKFEEALNDYFDTKGLHCIPVSSGTAGLHLQLLANDVGPGDEVITTPLTFCSTISTILQCGATPVFVDIDPNTYNIDIEGVVDKITAKTKAIVPVYYAGNAFDYDRLYELVKDRGILILADAAHAFGGTYKGKKIGTFEDAASFSFYATKNLTTGEGGLITTKNAEVANRIRKMRSFGMDKDAWKRYSSSGSWYYEITEEGFKYNFTDLQAAFGLHQLKKIDKFNKMRNEFANLYDDAFNDCEEIIKPPVFPNSLPTRHLYPLLIKYENLKIDRNEFIKELQKANIGISVHYVPIHFHSFFQKRLGLTIKDFPNSTWFYEREISLPIYTKLAEEDYVRIADTVKHIINQNL